MSWVGMVTGRPSAGLRMLLLDSIRMRASACASADSGRCTAIWSPSKSALNAVQTSGWIWMALPSTSCGSKAWMPRRCSVGARLQQHRVLGDDLFEHVPHDRAGALDHALGALDVLRVVEVDQALHDERLEQLERHLLGQAALVQLELRADDDDRTAGVVDALAEQVLAEPALLALEHVGQRLQRTVARAGDRTAAAAVVEQRVDGLLEHPLLVVDDDLGRAEVEQPLEAVVPVDDPAVEVVEVGGREPATVELHHRAQVRRDDRDAVEHHAHRASCCVVRNARDDLEALERAGLLLALAGADGLAQALGLGLEVEGLAGASGSPAAPMPPSKYVAEAVAHLAVEQLVALEVLDLEVLEAVPDLVEPVDLGVGAVAQSGASRARPTLAHLAAHVGLGALGLELGEVGLELLGAGRRRRRRGAARSAASRRRSRPRARAGRGGAPRRRPR